MTSMDSRRSSVSMLWTVLGPLSSQVFHEGHAPVDDVPQRAPAQHMH